MEHTKATKTVRTIPPSYAALSATMSRQRFAGAWLTDVDDTLIPSGVKPDDQWVTSLASFVHVLKQNNILWVPVSGVAIGKMEARLLSRLPEDLLSHVFFYGGEGSAKSRFDTKHNAWYQDKNFQRHFSDAQALALIGKTRFSNILTTTKDTEDEATSNARIEAAELVLQQADFPSTCLMDVMAAELQTLGFDPADAETHFRGGAVSWMMLGDCSVDMYRGETETSARLHIRDFAQTWLKKHNNLKALGELGVGMPYQHATRGIKMVLQGNDKGRAADDLIRSYGIPASSILFVGNELFDGGNDNAVRRVAGVHLLSVGEAEDAGVINGGVQVGANQQWMDWFASHLQQGRHWNDLLKKLTEQAQHIQLIQAIDKEKQQVNGLTTWHQRFAERISSTELADIILQHRPVLENTRHALVSLRNLEYSLLARLAVLADYHYDEARKIVCELAQEIDRQEEHQCYLLTAQIEDLLLSELKEILKQNYVDQLNVSLPLIDEHIDNIKHIDDVLPEFGKLFIHVPLLDYSEEKNKIHSLVHHWQKRIDTFVKDWVTFQRNWKQKKNTEQEALFADERLIQLMQFISKDDIYYYFSRLVPRLLDFPHLKDLNKPTLILVAGTSGVGKSTLSQYISKTLGISTYFSTDVTSRSVMRNAFRYIFGDASSTIFPALYGSSFDEDSLHWFYSQSLLSMIGTTGSLDRLVKENVSAVIDGVSLIPGTLDEKYFEIANIVWVVACIKDEAIHYQRMDKRDETGVSRGGAERYKRKIKVIRNNHDRLIKMGERAGCFIADNSTTLSHTLERMLQHIKTPYSNRGLPVDDPLRDEVMASLEKKVEQLT